MIDFIFIEIISSYIFFANIERTIQSRATKNCSF